MYSYQLFLISQLYFCPHKKIKRYKQGVESVLLASVVGEISGEALKRLVWEHVLI